MRGFAHYIIPGATLAVEYSGSTVRIQISGPNKDCMVIDIPRPESVQGIHRKAAK